MSRISITGLNFLIIVLLLSPASSSRAADYYSDQTLASKRASYLPNLEFTVRNQLLGPASDEVRAKLQDVQIVMPLRYQAQPRAPMQFYSDTASKQLILPVSSMKFYSDLSVLYAWFVVHKCDTTPLLTYLQMSMSLRRESSGLKSPLEAFGLNEAQAVRDPDVDHMSGRILTTGMNFIIAHELGHIYFHDTLGPSGSRSIGQEVRADQFAMDLLAAARIPPAGIVLFFEASRFLDPKIEAASAATHPLSPSRILAVGQRLEQTPDQFIPAGLDAADLEKDRRRMQSISKNIKQIASALAHEAFVDVSPDVMHVVPPASFPYACSG